MFIITICITNTFFLNLGIAIPNGDHTSKKTFLVTCNGACRQIRALIEFDGGDADLFANEGQHPITSGLSCLSSTCSMCRAVSGNDYEETCSDMSTQSGNRYVENGEFTATHYFLLCSFYLMVYAWSAYANGNLQFFGNAQSVELAGECTGSDCQTGGGVTPTPPPPTGGNSKNSYFVESHKKHNFFSL